MIVLLDAPDSTGGRSRFAQHLAARLDFRLGAPHWGLPAQRLEAVLDRCPDRRLPVPEVWVDLLSDWALARPWQGSAQTASALNRVLSLARRLAALGAVRVRAPAVTARASAVDRATLESLDEVLSRVLPTVTVTAPNWTAARSLDLEAVAAECLSRFHDVAPALRALHRLERVTGTGDPAPSLVLVCESLGPRNWGGRPFGDGPAATFLNRALLEAGPRDLRLYLLNASERPLAELLTVRRSGAACPVLALGSAASAWLREVGVPHTRRPHPAWSSRFLHRSRPALGRAVRSLIEGDEAVLAEIE